MPIILRKGVTPKETILKSAPKPKRKDHDSMFEVATAKGKLKGCINYWLMDTYLRELHGEKMLSDAKRQWLENWLFDHWNDEDMRANEYFEQLDRVMHKPGARTISSEYPTSIKNAAIHVVNDTWKTNLKVI